MTFQDWKDSIVISLGKNTTSARPSIMKAATAGLCALITIAAMSPAHASSYDQSAALSYSEIKNALGPTSKNLNKLYGTEDNVIVLHTDENLRFIVANMKKGLLSRYINPNDTPEKINALEQLRKESGYESGSDEFKKIQLFTDLTEPMGGAFTSFTSDYADGEERKNGQRIAFFKAWTEYDTNNLDANFPQYTDNNEQKYFSFFHEMTHIVESKQYDPKYTTDFFILKTEAIADVATAMIMLRETGNQDDFRYNIMPLRYALSTDRTHMTVEIASAIMDTIDIRQVKNLDDRTLMHLAESKVNAYVHAMNEQTIKGQNGKHYSEAHYLLQKHIAFANAYVTDQNALPHEFRYAVNSMELLKQGQGASVVRDFSRAAMIASLNNLMYHGKLNEKLPHFVTALSNHIEVFNDVEAKKAYLIATKNGSFDVRVFVNSMGGHLDSPAFDRKAKNQQVISQYFEKVTGTHLEPSELSMTEIQPNTERSVIGRYTDKASANQPGMK